MLPQGRSKTESALKDRRNLDPRRARVSNLGLLHFQDLFTLLTLRALSLRDFQPGMVPRPERPFLSNLHTYPSDEVLMDPRPRGEPGVVFVPLYAIPIVQRPPKSGKVCWVVTLYTISIALKNTQNAEFLVFSGVEPTDWLVLGVGLFQVDRLH